MASRPRVLQVLQPEDGGVAEHVLLLSRGLKERGFGVEVALSAANVTRLALEQAGIPTHALPLVREPGPADLAAAWELLAIDRRGGYDLVHAHSSKAGALVRAVLPGRGRLVYTPHCFAFAAPGDPGTHLLYRSIERALLRRTAALMTVAHWERRLAERVLRAGPPRLRLVPNGVPPCPDVEPDPELLEFRGDRPLAGMVAVLRPQKDPLTAVRAAALMSGDAGEGGRLAIVGNGELKPRVEEQIRTLGVSERVRWFPFKPPSTGYLRALDVFVMPARWEALPIAIAEAMRCELPVVATRVGGVPEMLDDGVTGRLVAPGADLELARAIDELIGDEDRRRAMGRAARAAAEERFSSERMLDATATVYRELLAAREGTGRATSRRATPVAAT